MSQRIRLQEAIKLALSMTLFYWLALWMDWDQPHFGALAIVVVSLATTGASLNKGIMRVAGTALGALAGFVLLFWFAQSPAGMLLGVSVYLVATAYVMQTSRQADIWFNAGFIAVAVWSSSYMKVDTAFHFATTRFLETAAGVAVFTLVAMVLWPRTSAPVLRQQGQALWQGLQRLFESCRGQLLGHEVTDDVAEQRARVAGAWQQLQSTLDAAYADTPVIAAQKRSWELLRTGLTAFGNSQELWRESIEDCRKLDTGKLIPGLQVALDHLAGRLAAGAALWQEQAPANPAAAADTLLAPLELTIDERAAAGLSRSERAALANFVEQLKVLDHSSRELLQALRVIAGIDPADRLRELRHAAADFRPLRWNPERLLKASFPALCWIAAFALWVYVQPPGGPMVPMMAAAFGLVMVMAPVNLMGLLLLLLLSIFIAVAPVYLFVMPQLDSGFGLLALIFLYTLFFAWLGGRSPALKIGPLMMFVMMANISNDQQYSFMLLVAAGLMMMLGVGTVVLVHRLLSPMHPEKILLRTLRRFFRGCARIVDSYAMLSPRQYAAGRRRRKRLLEARVQPLPAQLQTLAKNLDYRRFPDNDEGKVRALLNSLYSLRNRLQALEATCERAASLSPGLLHQVQPLRGEWRRRIQAVFEKWARLEPADELIDAWGGEQDLSHDLRQRLDELQRDGSDAPQAQTLYALIGSINSLMEAMHELQSRMHGINWEHWATERF